MTLLVASRLNSSVELLFPLVRNVSTLTGCGLVLKSCVQAYYRALLQLDLIDSRGKRIACLTPLSPYIQTSHIACSRSEPKELHPRLIVQDWRFFLQMHQKIQVQDFCKNSVYLYIYGLA